MRNPKRLVRCLFEKNSRQSDFWPFRPTYSSRWIHRNLNRYGYHRKKIYGKWVGASITFFYNSSTY